MAEHKDYGLVGVGRNLQFGKQGPVLVGNADTDTFTVAMQDGTTPTTMGGANATETTHFITKGQLDVVYTEAVFKANVNYNDSSPILLGNISSGTKTIITTFTVSTAFDDANAVVTIGTPGNNSLLMSDDYCEIENTGVYQTINTVEIASNTSLNIYVTQASAGAGVGNVLVSVVDGPVVNSGVINYGGAGGGNANIGDFVFSNTQMTTTGDDIFIKSPDDLYLDALNDDVVVRANDDIRLRTGFDFNLNTYDWELRFTDTGTVIFYNPTVGYDFGYIRNIDNAGSYGVSLEGYNDAYIKSSNGNYTWKFNNDGTAIVPTSSYGYAQFYTGGANLYLGSSSYPINIVGSDGSVVVPGNVTATSFIGDGSQLTGISAGNYGNSNVVTLLSSFGSNTISTTGNVNTGNVTTAAGKNIYLGNTSSKLTQLGSNASIQLSDSVILTPDTSASALNGVSIGGNGYLLGPNNARNITLNYNGTNGVVGLQGNVQVGSGGSGGSLLVPGTLSTGIASIVAGVTNTLLPNTVASFSANVNNYTQVTLQNKSTGTDATADFIITADNGSDTVNYADFGIINSGYDNTTPTNSLGNIIFAGDTYLYAQGNASSISQSGGNIAIGATVSGKSVKIFAGGANSTSIVGTFSSTGLAVTGNVSATGITKTEQIHEVFTTKTSATGTVTHDCSTGQVFSHSSISANFTANFTNLNLDSGYATTVTLVLNQGGTAYIPNAVQIGGASQTINWQGGSAPSGNANKKDVVSFSILNSSGTYTVLGQLTSFG